MWEWREDTTRGRWRLSATGSWLWDEPSDLDRYADGYEGLTRPLPLPTATGLPGTDPGGSSWVGAPSWSEPVGVGPGPASATPSWLAEHSWLPADDVPIGSRPYLDDSSRDGLHPDEPTPIFEAVAEERDGGGGAHAADGLHGEHPDIPSPTPGSGPLPVQRLEALREAVSPEDELRRRAERRRRPLVVAAAEPGRHARPARHGRT